MQSMGEEVSISVEIGQMASLDWERGNLPRKRTCRGARYEKLNPKVQFSAAV